MKRMKTTLVWLSIAFIINTIEATAKGLDKCTDTSSLPTPVGCRQYYACQKGTYQLNHCKNGTRFDPKHSLCSNQAKCIGTIRKCQNKLKFYVMKNEKQYYECSSGLWVRKKCPREKFFHKKKLSCVYKHEMNYKHPITHVTKKVIKTKKNSFSKMKNIRGKGKHLFHDLYMPQKNNLNNLINIRRRRDLNHENILEYTEETTSNIGFGSTSQNWDEFTETNTGASKTDFPTDSTFSTSMKTVPTEVSQSTEFSEITYFTEATISTTENEYKTSTELPGTTEDNVQTGTTRITIDTTVNADITGSTQLSAGTSGSDLPTSYTGTTVYITRNDITGSTIETTPNDIVTEGPQSTTQNDIVTEVQVSTTEIEILSGNTNVPLSTTRNPIVTDATEGSTGTTGSNIVTDDSEGPSSTTGKYIVTDITEVLVTTSDIVTDNNTEVPQSTTASDVTDATDIKDSTTESGIVTDNTEVPLITTGNDMLTDITDTQDSTNESGTITDNTEFTQSKTASDVTDVTDTQKSTAQSGAITDNTKVPQSTTGNDIVTDDIVTGMPTGGTEIGIITDNTKISVGTTDNDITTDGTDVPVGTTDNGIITENTEVPQSTTGNGDVTDFTDVPVVTTESGIVSENTEVTVGTTDNNVMTSITEGPFETTQNHDTDLPWTGGTPPVSQRTGITDGTISPTWESVTGTADKESTISPIQNNTVTSSVSLTSSVTQPLYSTTEWEGSSTPSQ